MNTADAIKMKVAELEQAILNQHPTMPTLLKQMHTALRQEPELLHMLSDEEIGVIVQGLSKQTNTVIVTAAAKGNSKAGKVAKSLNLAADLGM